MKTIAAALTAVLLCGSALARAGDAPDRGPAVTVDSNGRKAADGAAVATNSADFVTALAQYDAFIRKANEIAAQRGTGDAVRQLSSAMNDETSETEKALKAVADRSRLTVPTDLNSRGATMIADLNGATNNDFDSIYAKQVVALGTEEMTTLKAYADRGDDADLKSLAARTIPHLEDHVRAAKGVLAEHGGANTMATTHD